jgi:ferrochelatase
MRNKENTAILFVNLGTPENLTISSIRKNLKEFLMDKRVIDLPFFLRFIIVYFFIIPFRPFNTLKKYQEVWNYNLNLSPLIYYSEQFIKKTKRKDS